MRESTIQALIRKAIALDGRALVTRNNVGVLKDERGVPMRFGLGVGSPDLIGILRSPLGVVFAVEVKTIKGRLTTHQEAWWRAARKWGVRGGVARSIEEAMALLDEASDK